MQYKKGIDRTQLFFTSMEEMVPEDSFARVIDIMVDSLPLSELGFTNVKLNHEGNEPFHPADLLKLLIYGQRFGIRSANKLSRSALINTEVIWLLKGLHPSPRTICYYRTNNVEAIKKAHRHFVKRLQNWNVIEGDVLALDSTKVRGQNSLKNNLPVRQAGFNQKKINRHLEYLEGKIDKYLKQLDQLKEQKKSQPKAKEIKNRIRNAEGRICYYEQMQEHVDNSIDGQVSTSDPDARAVIKHRNIVEVGYNLPTVRQVFKLL